MADRIEDGGKRTRLSPVYLTAAERELIVNGLSVLTELLARDLPNEGKVNAFARAYTAQRIKDVIALFQGRKS